VIGLIECVFLEEGVEKGDCCNRILLGGAKNRHPLNVLLPNKFSCSSPSLQGATSPVLSLLRSPFALLLLTLQSFSLLCLTLLQSAMFGFLSYALFFCFSGLTLFFHLIVGHENAEVERRVVIFVAFVEVVEVAVVVVVAEVVVLYDLRRSRIDTGGAEVAIQFFRRNRPERLEYDADFPGARLDRSRGWIPPRPTGRRRPCGEDSGQVIGEFHQD
jgi:hypothetical protein